MKFQPSKQVSVEFMHSVIVGGYSSVLTSLAVTPSVTRGRAKMQKR